MLNQSKADATNNGSSRNYSSNNEQNAKWRPAWEKASNNYLYQIIKCDRTDTYDDDGNVTLSEYTATFEKSKTDAALQGQKNTERQS